MAESSRRLQAQALVALRADPTRRGKVLKISRNRKFAHVQFEGYSRTSLHAVEGLLLLSPSPQLTLFRR
ncbi:MAG: hypothetical protein ACRD1R_12875 [Acidobacteriota bacterium]